MSTNCYHDECRNKFECELGPFTLSIEDVEGHSFQHGFHLGTDERLAREIAQEKFHARVKAGLPVVTVGLIQAGKLVDVYYGDRWHSED